MARFDDQRFRPATLEEYLRWLSQFINYNRRRQPTHYYDRSWASEGFVFAAHSFVLRNEHGSAARLIIVGDNARHLSGLQGHNVLFHLGKPHIVPSRIPVYNDPAFRKVYGVARFIDENDSNADTPKKFRK